MKGRRPLFLVLYIFILLISEFFLLGIGILLENGIDHEEKFNPGIEESLPQLPFVIPSEEIEKRRDYRQIFVRSSSFCKTWGEHVVYKNCSECQKQFLYTTCSPQV